MSFEATWKVQLDHENAGIMIGNWHSPVLAGLTTKWCSTEGPFTGPSQVIGLEYYWLASSLKPDVIGYGMLVADGMGGMAGGDVASRLALSKLIELIVDTSDWTLALERQKT